jgi:hypothetical protein
MANQSNISGYDLGYVQLRNFDAAAVPISALIFDSQPGPGAPVGTEILMIRTEVTAARYRTDGIAPTATVGYLLPPRQVDIMINVAQFPQFQVIGTTPATVLNMVAIGQTPP